MEANRFQLHEICDALSNIEKDDTLTNSSGVKNHSEAKCILKLI